MRIPKIMTGMVAAVALLTVASPAHADVIDSKSCTASITLPSKLVIKSWSSIVTAHMSDPSDCVSSATWSIVNGTVDTTASASFSSPNTIDRVSFYTGPSGSHAGTYRAVADYAYSDDTYLDADGYEQSVEVVQQDSGLMVAKYASKLSWKSVVRSGSHVTLRAVAKRYSLSRGFGGYVAWKHTKALVQKKVGSTWRTVKTVKTDSKGVATARLSGAARTWRIVALDSSTTWGDATTSKHR